jgi:hypothetical protein
VKRCEKWIETGGSESGLNFEYESHNFVTHMHPESGCDLIVCWHNNWPDCPLEVLELQSIVMPGFNALRFAGREPTA